MSVCRAKFPPPATTLSTSSLTCSAFPSLSSLHMNKEEDWLDDTAYDVIVVGTGLTESIAAAALARVGRKVLHIDSLPFYGEPYSTHTLPALREWLIKLSCDSSANGLDAEHGASDALVHPEAVERARRIAET